MIRSQTSSTRRIDHSIKANQTAFWDKNYPKWAIAIQRQGYIVHMHTWKDPFLVISPDQFFQWRTEAIDWYKEDNLEMLESLGKIFTLLTICFY